MSKNTTDFNVRVNLDSKGVASGAGSINGLLGGIGAQGLLAGKNINAGMLKAAVGIGGAVIALGAMKKAFEFALDKGMEFEQGIADVRATLGASNSDFRALSEEAQRLGRSTKFTATEVAGLEKEYGKLGFQTEEILGATEATLALAAAVGSDLSRSAEVAGGTLRGFGLEATETGRVADVMAKSFTTSALDMEKFANSMVYVAPVAKAFNFTIEDSTALLGTLANVQISGSMAGTSLRNILSQMSVTGSKMSKVFGTTVKNFDELVDVFKEAKAQGGLTNAQIGQIPIRLRSATIALVDASDTLKDYARDLENAAGAAEVMAEIQMDTLRGSTIELNSAMEGLGIALYEDVLPSFGLGSESLKSFVDKIATMANAFTDFIKIDLSTKMEEDRIAMLASAQSAIEAKEGTEERTKAIQLLQLQYPEYFRNLDIEKSTNADIADEIDRANKAMMTKISIQVRQEQIGKLLAKVTEQEDDVAEKEIEIIKKVVEFEEMFREQADKLMNQFAFGSAVEQAGLTNSDLYDPVLVAQEQGLDYYAMTSSEQLQLMVDHLNKVQGDIQSIVGVNNFSFWENLWTGDPTQLQSLRMMIQGGSVGMIFIEGLENELTALQEELAKTEGEVNPIIDRLNARIEKLMEKLKGTTPKDDKNKKPMQEATTVTVSDAPIVPNLVGYESFQNRLLKLNEGGLTARLALFDKEREKLQEHLAAQFNSMSEAEQKEFDLKSKNAEIINGIEAMKAEFIRQQRLQELSEMSNNAKNAAKQGVISGKTAKAVAISEALVSTYLGATKAYTALSGIPVIGPALGMAAKAMAVAGGLANIKAIQKAKFAKGGAVTSPTLAMIGEAGEEEFVAPKQQFSEWANQTLGIDNKFNDTNIVGKLSAIETAIKNQPNASSIAREIGKSNRGRL